MLSRLAIPFLAALALVAGCAPQPAKGPLVLAAASLEGSLDEVADAWAAEGHPRPVISYAGTPALARQIESGAPADIFLSADEEWMDRLAKEGLVKGERRDLLANRLVLVAPATSRTVVDLDNPSSLPLALPPGTRVAMADPQTVPAGKYGKAALERLGLWNALKNRIAPAENVRAALALVETGEAPLGVVYQTDAMLSERVRVIAVIPPETHPPIVYPVALLKPAPGREAQGFYYFLAGKPASAIFARYGFRTP